MKTPDFSLDTLGMYCPLPVIFTSKKMREMTVDQVLEVLSDDKGIKKDMPIWCKNSGNELIEIIEKDGVIKIYLRKKT